MKTSAICSALLLMAVTVSAYTPAETNWAVQTMMFNIQLSPESRDVLSVPDDNRTAKEPIEPTYPTYESLFSEESGFGLTTWTPEERRTAFENFLLRIPELSTNGQYHARHKAMLRVHGDIAFSYCLAFEQTNCLSAALQIIADTNSECRSIASRVFEKFACPSSETYLFVERVMTNRTEEFMTKYQSYFLGSFGTMLLNHRNDTSPDIISNGVRLIHRSIERKEGWNSFDRVMKEFYPDYAMSSNRLAFAITALDAEPPPGKYGEMVDRTVKSRFTPVTNALLNSSEPLKVLDLSWLNEPMISGNTGNTNETEQQEESND